MKKMILASVVALTMFSTTSAFAADDLCSVGKAVGKTSAKVAKHVSIDVLAVSKTVVKDVFNTGKYLVVGGVNGSVAVGSQVKHAIKK